MRRDKKSSPETDSPQVRVRIDGESAIADLSGDIDGEAAAAMEGAYELTGSSGPIVLNFSQVGYINSAGIAWVIGLMRRALADGRPVAAFGLTPHYEEMFSITRLSEFIAVHTDEASALAAAH